MEKILGIVRGRSVTKKLTYEEALISAEARNCGLYLVYEGNNLIYIGKASGQTLKRRLSEHVSYDNQYNTLTKKMGKKWDIPLWEIDKIIEKIIMECKFVLIPYPVHSYDQQNSYSYNFDLRNEIKEKEVELINELSPSLNKLKKILNRVN